MSRGTILVAGRNGQLARALPPALAAEGWEVVALGRPQLDLGDPVQVAAVVRSVAPALIVNAAAYTAVDRAEDEPQAAMAINRDGAAALATAAASVGAPILQVSTDYVFDGSKGAPYVETDPVAPLGAYGRSKLAGERAVREANPRSAVLRTAWLCSATGQNFLRTMLRLGAERDVIGVVDDQCGCPTFVDDLAAAIAAMAPRLIAAPQGAEAFGVFHLAGAPHVTWHGFAAAILDGAAARGHPRPRLRAITTADYPTRAPRPADSRLDCGRIRVAHRIALPDWRQGLGRALDALLGTPAAPFRARLQESLEA